MKVDLEFHDDYVNESGFGNVIMTLSEGDYEHQKVLEWREDGAIPMNGGIPSPYTDPYGFTHAILTEIGLDVVSVERYVE